MNRLYIMSALAVFALAGCEADLEPQDPIEDLVAADELVSALPTAEMLTARYPGYQAPEKADGSSSKMMTVDEATCAFADDEDTALLYQDGCRTITYMNSVVADVMELLHEATLHEPTHQGGGVYLWGPFENEAGVTLMFGMQKNEDGSIGYQLDGKMSAGDDDPSNTDPDGTVSGTSADGTVSESPEDDSSFLTILRGRIEAGVDLGHNIGSFDLSYDNMQAVDPSLGVGGFAEFDYDSLGTQTGVEARIQNLLTADSSIHQAAASYFVNADSSGELWYSYTEDLFVAEDSALQETATAHARWLSDGAGRSDAIITGGDLDEETGFLSECWDASYLEVYAAANWAGERGDASLCVFESPQFP